MNESKIAVRYGRALFESALEQGILDQVSDDLKSILLLDKDLHEFRDLLESPILSVSRKVKVLTILFKGNLNDLTFRFVLLMTQNKREAFLPSVCRVFYDQYKLNKGIKSAKVTTAGVLHDDTAKRIKESLEVFFKSHIELDKEIKPELIGGFILRVDDKQLDASVASQLKKIRKELGQSVIS